MADLDTTKALPETLSKNKLVNAKSYVVPKIAVEGINQAYKLPYTTIENMVSPAGWEIIATSLDIQDQVNIYGLKVIAYKNLDTRAIHISFAGTDRSNLNDLFDDVRIFFGKTPAKFPAMQCFIQHIIDKQGGIEHLAESKITISGHSLGAVLSDLALAGLTSYGVSSSSTTFDNPGSAMVIKNAIKSNIFSGDKKELIMCELASNAQTYLAKKNFVNNMSFQLANDKFLVLPNKAAPEKLSKLWLKLLSPIANDLVDYAADILSEYISLKLDFRKIIDKTVDCINGFLVQLDSHKIVNFIPLTLPDSKDITTLLIDYSRGNQMVIIDKPMPEGLKNIPKANTIDSDIITLDTKYKNGFVEVDISGYNYSDLAGLGLPLDDSIDSALMGLNSENLEPTFSAA